MQAAFLTVKQILLLTFGKALPKNGSMQTENAPPKALTDAQRYKIFGGLTDRQRQLMHIIIDRSRKGEWTRYEHAEEVVSPEKRLSELTKRPELGIRMRHVEGTRNTVEFCV
jgi:hypothetical protein